MTHGIAQPWVPPVVIPNHRLYGDSSDPDQQTVAFTQRAFRLFAAAFERARTNDPAEVARKMPDDLSTVLELPFLGIPTAPSQSPSHFQRRLISELTHAISGNLPYPPLPPGRNVFVRPRGPPQQQAEYASAWDDEYVPEQQQQGWSGPLGPPPGIQQPVFHEQAAHPVQQAMRPAAPAFLPAAQRPRATQQGAAPAAFNKTKQGKAKKEKKAKQPRSEQQQQAPAKKASPDRLVEAKAMAYDLFQQMRYSQPEHGELQQQPGTSTAKPTAEQGKQAESGAPETTTVKD